MFVKYTYGMFKREIKKLLRQRIISYERLKYHKKKAEEYQEKLKELKKEIAEYESRNKGG